MLAVEVPIMDNDDKPVGRILTRRQLLRVLGVSGGAALTGAGLVGVLGRLEGTAQANTLPSCVVRPELTEGPYFVDEKLLRSDVRSDPKTGVVRAGVLLKLKFLVSRVGSNCTPLAGVLVDIWHCDAAGAYSDVRDRLGDTTGQKFLRGYQVTDAQGVAEFTTIYPGWYPGRAVHIHFKLRTVSGSRVTSEFTSQLFFNESLTDAVFAQQPYAAKGSGWMRNNQDNIYRNGGSQLLLTPAREGSGYVAAFDVGLNI
jgi:protocatechuate 3,4-dioxygenase beta subunit